MLMGRKGVIGRKGCPSRTEASPQGDPQRAGLDGMGLRAEAEISGESSELIGGASHQHLQRQQQRPVEASPPGQPSLCPWRPAPYTLWHCLLKWVTRLSGLGAHSLQS